MSDLTKIFAENQKEMLKLTSPDIKKSTDHQNLENFNSETENIHLALPSTLIKSKATTSKNNPISSRNKTFLFYLFETFLSNFLNDSVDYNNVQQRKNSMSSQAFWKYLQWAPQSKFQKKSTL